MFQQVTDAEGSILEPGNYVLTAKGIEDAGEGQFGPSIKWVFGVADPTSPDAPKYDDQGAPYEFWQFTSTKMSPRARARAWVEALIGRVLADGEMVNPNDVLGRSMIALVIHEEGTDGKTRAKISKEMKPKPFGKPAAKSNGRADGKLAPAADKSQRDQLLDSYSRGVKAVMAHDVPGREKWLVDGNELSIEQLYDGVQEMAMAVKAAQQPAEEALPF